MQGPQHISMHVMSSSVTHTMYRMAGGNGCVTQPVNSQDSLACNGDDTSVSYEENVSNNIFHM